MPILLIKGVLLALITIKQVVEYAHKQTAIKER
jgi:hypothetical protein